MPRLVDYVGRFEFIRMAAFAVVRDEGVDALSRRRVAAELGTGVNTIRRSVAGWADLAQLAADQVRARRRVGRLGRGSEDPTESATAFVRSLMPQDATHLDEELVWLKLVTACALRPSGLEPPGHVRREFQVAEAGYDDPALAGPTSSNEPAGQPADRRTVLQPYVEERDRELTSVIGLALKVLEAPEPAEDTVATVLALLEGLTLSVCLGRLTPERATELAVAHVIGLGRPQPAVLDRPG